MNWFCSFQKLFIIVSITCSTLPFYFFYFSVSCSLFACFQIVAFSCYSPQVLRLGNSADALESAKRAVHLSDVVLRFCITVSHLNRALYFACDNVLWAGKSGLAPRVDQEKWAQRSFRFDILLSHKTFCILPTVELALYKRKVSPGSSQNIHILITWLPIFI